MLILYAMYFARSLFVPIVFALFCYLTLRPMFRRLTRLGIPAPIMAAAVMGLTGIAMVVAGLVAYEPLKDVVAELPQSVDVIKAKAEALTERFQNVSEATDELSEVAGQVSGDIEDEPIAVEIKQPALTSNVAILSSTGSLVSFLSISVVLIYFLLAFGDESLKGILRRLPTLSDKKRLVGAIDDVQDAVGGYLIRVTVINFFLGVAVAIGMYAWGMPSPLAWGVMAMILNYIPVLGAILGAGVIFLTATLSFESSVQPMLVTATFLTLTTLEGQFITPSVLGRAMNVNPLLVVLSLIVFGWIWGFMGVLLSVPLLIAGQIILDHATDDEHEIEATMTTQRLQGRSSATIALAGSRPDAAAKPKPERTDGDTDRDSPAHDAGTEADSPRGGNTRTAAQTFSGL